MTVPPRRGNAIGAVGFIGVGTIADAVVRGLRAAWPDLPIRLSPRSEARSRALAAAVPGVRREGSNAAVVEASDLVVLSMLPAQLDAAVAGLPFRDGQVVASCVAAAPVGEVAALVAPARACRLVPLPMIARREGPVLLHPPLPEVRALFAPLGDLIEPGDEVAFSAYVAGSAAMSTFLAFEGAVAAWMASRGASEASTYARSLFRALAETAYRDGDVDFPTLVTGHETPGGLNERVRLGLDGRGWFDAPSTAFDGMTRLGRADLDTERGAR